MAFDDDQRYLFDLQGWITIPGALDPGQLESLNAEFDRRVAAAVPPDANTWRFVDLLDWGPDWVNLIDNPRVLDVLDGILGPGFRLDHDYADLIRRGDAVRGQRDVRRPRWGDSVRPDRGGLQPPGREPGGWRVRRGRRQPQGE